MSKNNFTDSLDYLSTISKEIIDLLPFDKVSSPPIWVKHTESIFSMILEHSIEKYDLKNVDEKDRFPIIRKKFESLYDENRDVLNKSFIIMDENDKPKPNDSWIKLEDKQLISGLSKSRGITICLKKGDDKTEDLEIPISELYNAALYIKKNKIVESPNYPICIIYAIYNCILHSTDKDSDSLNNIILEMAPATEKKATVMADKMSGAKPYIKAFVNTGLLDELFTKINSGIDEISDDDIDGIAEQAHAHIELLTRSGEMNLSDFLPGSADLDSSLQKNGLSTETLRNMLDKHSSGKMTTEELKKSIPTIDDLFEKKD